MARLSLSLLGPFQAALDDAPVTGFESDKARALLAYLAIEANRPQRRDGLIDMFWPDLSQTAARNNLRHALANIRTVIGDYTANPPFLLVRTDAIQFNRASDCWLDVERFDALLAACDHHSHLRAETCRVCAQRRQEATDLYQGEFLAQFTLPNNADFNDWAGGYRVQLVQQVIDALFLLATFYERRGDYARAIDVTLRLLRLDPWQEEAQRQHMRLLERNGQRSAALTQYERYHQILVDELGVEPEEATTALYERLRDARSRAVSGDTRLPMFRTQLIHLPAPPTPLIGRAQEVAAVRDLLLRDEVRMVTLVGPPGIGKTRLGLQVATELQPEFADGVYFVALASISDPTMVASAIAHALGVWERNSRPLPDVLKDYLREKQLLLLLDNFEQTLAAAPLVAELLETCPEVQTLVTSRAALQVRAERLILVQPLEVPEPNDLSDHVTIGRAAAVALFVERVQAIWPDFLLTAENARTTAMICRRLDGLPLAIELIAARVPAQPLELLLTQLDNRLALLIDGPRDLPQRQRTLRDAIAWSYDLLTAPEQQLFAWMSVFVSGCTSEVLTAIESGMAATEQLQRVQTLIHCVVSLVDKSLLARTLGTNSVPRFTMLESLRAFAEERLMMSGEAEAVLLQRALYLTDLAERAEPEFQGAEQTLWLARLDDEHDNVRATLAWCQTQRQIGLGLRLASALWQFWVARGHLSEGRVWLADLLQKTTADGPTSARAKALNAAGYLAFYQDDYPTAQALYADALAMSQVLADERNTAVALFGHRTALAHLWQTPRDYATERAFFEEPLMLFRQLDDSWGTARALNRLARVARRHGDYATGRTLHQEALALQRALGDQQGTAATLNSLGVAAQSQGDLKVAHACYEESLATYRVVGDQWGIAGLLTNLGEVARQQGDDVLAATCYEGSVRLCQEMGNYDGIGLGLHGLGQLARRRGDLVRAIELFLQSLAMHRAAGSPSHIAMCMAALGGVAQMRGRTEQAARLLGAAEALYDASGAPMDAADRADFERDERSVRAQLDPWTFAKAWADGKSMSVDQAINEARVIL